MGGLEMYTFNGAALFRARRQDGLVGHRLEMYAFNGAALFRARRHRDRVGGGFRWEAFNGAALFRARRLDCPKEEQKQEHPFNGAALFRARRLARAYNYCSICCVLQWGRALSSAETQPTGPSGWEGRTLQWGRALSSAETPRPMGGRCPGGPGFNGAALFRARRLPAPKDRQASLFASMGPRSFERGDPAGGGTATIGRTRPSMGPRSFERGDPG